ncbi:MAG: uncharacterized protein JWM91_3797 [Rhodospirillales bacterium]|nr:uncharacterized protein [Rhodospirillales bacterium]
MSIAARRGPPSRYEWSDQYDRHDWHGRTMWHAGPALVGIMVLGFIFCWPVGIAALALMIWSVKMTCGHLHGGEGRWGERWQERMTARRARWEQKMAEHHDRQHRSTSGNRAFDEYRAETLRRLEDEEKEFREFLNQLRFAKDKAEFDDFLANRRPPAPPETPAQN